MAPSKKRRKILVFSLIGGVLVILAALALFKKREVAITVQTVKAVRTNLTERVSANGKIQPVIQVKISPEVSGEIIELPVKEGQHVQKGDLLLKIKPDFYIANRNQAEAAYKSSLADKATAEANLRKAKAEFKRNEDLYRQKLVSASAFDEVQAAYDVARAQVTSAEDQVEMARASLASAEDALAKTTIVSPLTGTVSKLDSAVGERVVGTATMAGTEVMTIADLNQMEARVDVGETDVVLISPGQHARLDVDAFKDRKFSGTVTEIANSSKTNPYTSGNNQEATKFEVKIRIKEKAPFRPGMSVTAEIETRSRTNVLVVPLASVTTRVLKSKAKPAQTKLASLDPKPSSPRPKTNTPAAKSNTPGSKTNALAATTNAPAAEGTNTSETACTSPQPEDRKPNKPVEVVFVVEGDRVKAVPVKIGISDDTYWEITKGLKEGQEIVSGGYRALMRDLQDGKKILKGPAGGEKEEDVKP